ncbi:MAG: hypothetical protein AB7F09_16640 [Parvibaculaceae bacterium]
MARKAAWRWPALVALTMAAGAPTAASAQDLGDAFTDHLQRQIICQSAPDPTATLLYLSRKKRIDAKKGERADSETCWKIYPVLKIDGVGFMHVCASAEDPLLIELFPLFYFRGPGTSPGTGLRLVTTDAEAAVDDWLERAKERLGIKGDTRLDIGEASSGAGKTEISCNSTSFLAGE